MRLYIEQGSLVQILVPRGLVVLNDCIMPSVISCVCWVKKGVSKEIPDQVSVTVIIISYYRKRGKGRVGKVSRNSRISHNRETFSPGHFFNLNFFE